MPRNHGLTLATLAVLSVPAILAAQRDWAALPAVVQIDTPENIYAIGDIHGDSVRFTRLLIGAGLIAGVPKYPRDVHWIAGRSVLVITGDMIDKGPRILDVFRVLDALQKSAALQGGRVVILAGNHEAEFLADPSAKKGREFAEQLLAEELSPVAIGSCKTDLGIFLCSLPFAARVNDWFFSHAGNSGGQSIQQLQTSLERGFSAHGFAAQEITGDYSLLEARLNGSGKGREPWIDAGLPQRSEQQLLEDYTRALGVTHIVEGHVPSEVRFADGTVRRAGEMFQRFGLLFLIDTGMSEQVNLSAGAALHISRTSATAICPDGRSTVLWDANHPQSAGRAAPCK
ncbi:MAG TPA: metallophosphoesterase [Bryobacteraceae bacterium]|nr:metallophosphoesterase [Bryobacteraceae bacterium]